MPIRSALPASATTPTAPESELHHAWRSLAGKCLTRPATIHGEANAEDASCVLEDLEHIEREFNRLLHAYGVFASGHFRGVNVSTFELDFSDITAELHDAIDRLNEEPVECDRAMRMAMER